MEKKEKPKHNQWGQTEAEEHAEKVMTRFSLVVLFLLSVYHVGSFFNIF